MKHQKIQIQFEATPKGNCLYSTGICVYCHVPLVHEVDETVEDDDPRYWDKADGVSDYYGYLTMKRAILNNLDAHGIPTDCIEWWYDTDDGLPADAEAGEAIDLDIDYEAVQEALEE